MFAEADELEEGTFPKMKLVRRKGANRDPCDRLVPAAMIELSSRPPRIDALARLCSRVLD